MITKNKKRLPIQLQTSSKPRIITSDPATDIIWTKNYSDYKKREKTPDPATNIIWTKNYGDYEKA
ncbi:uncharacterized protein EAE97_008773 [Botrytis byssoidea]|uniref:Uncharacterized protein n=1 Tax=Botrytis byssoidea TaxID=139641 RepID=A0A9P5LZV6_9HELO|nr:uncharacterized protein EAE97_008773 [Botrytis byssoidea]KAF7933006.1 hypothetical protein EAE97_008773 [Botrytis byssoidea]